MKAPPIFLLAAILSIPSWAAADASTQSLVRPAGAEDPAFPTPAPIDPAKLKEGVQVTELGCLRAMTVFQKDSIDVEKLVTQRLSDSDFRVFGPYVVAASTLPDATQSRDLGNDRKADLVVLTSVTSRELNKLGNFIIFEAEATVRIYSPVSNEIQVIHTARAKGERHTDPMTAERNAREKAADLCAREAVAKSLGKAHKMLVHEAQIGGVENHEQLLKILEYTSKKEGVYHARQLTYDAKTKVAVIEIIGAPSTESFWRSWMTQMPKRKVIKEDIQVRFIKNEQIRKKYPQWFNKE